MGCLRILVCICISSFSRDSQGRRFPFPHKESCSIHSHSVFMHNKIRRALCVTCNDSKVMLLNSANSSFSSLFQLRHDAKGIFWLGEPKGLQSD